MGKKWEIPDEPYDDDLHWKTGERCLECAGSGEMDLHDIHPDELAGILSNPKCPTCNGTGQAPKQDDEAMEQAWIETWREFGRRIDRVDYFQKGWKACARKSDDRLKSKLEQIRIRIKSISLHNHYDSSPVSESPATIDRAVEQCLEILSAINEHEDE